MNMNGTPKSLEQAIARALVESNDVSNVDDKVIIIKTHVIDYLSQKFNYFMMTESKSGAVLEQLFLFIKKGK